MFLGILLPYKGIQHHLHHRTAVNVLPSLFRPLASDNVRSCLQAAAPETKQQLQNH